MVELTPSALTAISIERVTLDLFEARHFNVVWWRRLSCEINNLWVESDTNGSLHNSSYQINFEPARKYSLQKKAKYTLNLLKQGVYYNNFAGLGIEYYGRLHKDQFITRGEGKAAT